MKSNNAMFGLMYIAVGIMIIVMGAPLLWNILLTLLALWLINYGLQLRGSAPLVVWAQRAFDEIQSIFRKR